MLDHLVHEYVSSEVSNDLVHVDHRVTAFVVFDSYGLHVGRGRVQLPPLVFAHVVAPGNSSALDAVRPVDVWMQHRENRLKVASVEGLVRRCE